MYNVPDYLLKDILSRLRAKSLLRFRSVSRSWRTLIDSPSFIKIHMERSVKLKMEQSSVEVIHRCNLIKFHSLHLDLLSGDPKRDPEELAHPFGYRYDLDKSVSYTGKYEIHLVGSCNGLLCFVDSAHRIVLWNLAIHKYFELQCSGIELPKFVNRVRYVTYGFGYDSTTDDYKVIRLITAYNKRSLSECLLVELYSLKSDSWTRFEDLEGYAFGVNYGVLLGGALHWLRYQPDLECTIVGFDLTKEEFNIVPCPYLSGKFTLMNLGNFQGCLSLLCQFDEAYSSIMWVMKELGIKESWSMVFIVYIIDIDMRPIDHSKRKRSIFLDKNNNSLQLYNIEDNSYTEALYGLSNGWDDETFCGSIKLWEDMERVKQNSGSDMVYS
ncbi:F-box protein CPR30 [Abeliophyllum distichum]|uniref:F-box protein CPR30 n=1 Tax=Abeliophyllum distichum TaxID=126358 RepID=A0ABD1V9F2_9LAMI